VSKLEFKSDAIEVHDECKVVEWNLEIKMSDDFKTRLSSNPAGTANMFTFHAIAVTLSKSLYAIASPSLPTFAKGSTTSAAASGYMCEVVRQFPALFHMGAKWLFRVDRIVLPSWSEDEMNALTSFITVVAPSSSLAKAGVLKNKEECKTSEVYATMSSLKVALASKLDVKLILKILSKRGISSDNFGVEMGTVTLKEIQDAQKELEDEKKTSSAASSAVSPKT
jgi:hypothetical protein